MNDFLSTFGEVIEKLESAQIDYMVVGSIASIIYGEPRLTNDMDIVVTLKPEDTPKLLKIFDNSEYYVPPIEILSQEVINCGQFNIIHTNSGLKVDMIVLKKSDHATEEFSRKTKQDFLPNLEVFVATPEDIIIKKLVYYDEGRSNKHLEDIKGILANTPIDSAYLSRWIERLHLEDLWKLVSPNEKPSP